MIIQDFGTILNQISTPVNIKILQNKRTLGGTKENYRFS
jgi:hypothetical protein